MLLLFWMENYIVLEYEILFVDIELESMWYKELGICFVLGLNYIEIYIWELYII